jgi:hypothetical protein
MERTKQNKGFNELSVNAKIQAYSTLLSRAQLMNKLGSSYEGDRNLYQALGYPVTIDVADYENHYKRQDIAKAIIDRPIDATWKGDLFLVETSKVEDTPIEKAWLDILSTLSLKKVFKRLDKLTCLNTYGILLFGFDDVQNKEGFAKPITTSRALKLMYLKPFGASDATINEYQSDPKNSRYGLPINYRVVHTLPGTNNTQEMIVHYTRVLHIIWDPLKDEVNGTPLLESVFNRLLDLEKLVGGSAEMFWRGARPGFQGKVDKDYQVSENMMEGLQSQLDEYEHNLRRFLVNEGVEMAALESQISDPSSHVEAQIQMISAATGIPKRILIGSERGELASTQDQDSWNGIIQARREEWAELNIVRPFIEKCFETKVLSKVDTYTIQWTDVFAMGEEQKARVGQIRSSALRDYASQPGAEFIVPVDAFFQYFLGLKADQIEMINSIREGSMDGIDKTMEDFLEPEDTETKEQDSTSTGEDSE